jgi:hypothetical protein
LPRNSRVKVIASRPMLLLHASSLLLLLTVPLLAGRKGRRMRKMPHPYYRSSFRCDCGHFQEQYVVGRQGRGEGLSEPAGVHGAEVQGVSHEGEATKGQYKDCEWGTGVASHLVKLDRRACRW